MNKLNFFSLPLPIFNQEVQVNEWFVNEANATTIQTASDFIFSKTNDFKFVKDYFQKRTEKED